MSHPKLHIVPDDPGPEYPRTGYCNDQDRDCRQDCAVERCPHGKTAHRALTWREIEEEFGI